MFRHVHWISEYAHAYRRIQTHRQPYRQTHTRTHTHKHTHAHTHAHAHTHTHTTRTHTHSHTHMHRHMHIHMHMHMHTHALTHTHTPSLPRSDSDDNHPTPDTVGGTKTCVFGFVEGKRWANSGFFDFWEGNKCVIGCGKDRTVSFELLGDLKGIFH